MPKINLKKVKKSLWENETIRDKIKTDYGIKGNPDNPDEFAEALLESLTLDVATTKFDVRKDNNAVFKAAVFAIGSNNRRWSTFREKEPGLNEYLCGYDFAKFNNIEMRKRKDCIQVINDLAGFFPGRTATNDAIAVLRWASLLESVPEFHELLKELIKNLGKSDITEESEHLPSLAALIGNNALSNPNIEMPDALNSLNRIAPGMGSPLASEFLRNLGLQGFKPDTHIKRLFNLWFPKIVGEKKVRALEIAGKLGSGNKEVVENITYSLVGIDVMPSGGNASHVDSLIWALGSYVEKNGNESDANYINFKKSEQDSS